MTSASFSEIISAPRTIPSSTILITGISGSGIWDNISNKFFNLYTLLELVMHYSENHKMPGFPTENRRLQYFL